jgi:hypothetical protein
MGRDNANGSVGAIGIEESIMSKNEKADWDAAVQLALELEQGAGETNFDDDEEEEEFLEEDEDDQDFDEDEDDDEEEDDDIASDYDLEDPAETEGDLEEIARAARAAVEMMQEGPSGKKEPTTVVPPTPPVRQDWESFTVAQLKNEIKTLGLTAYGKKVDLVAALRKHELEVGAELDDIDEDDDDDEDDDFDYEVDMDLEDIGKQARAAVQMYEKKKGGSLSNLDLPFDGDEPSDDVLLQLENGEIDIFDDDDGEDIAIQDASLRVDYTTMTVSELKDVLKKRGQKVTGKKAELIERLESIQ